MISDALYADAGAAASSSEGEWPRRLDLHDGTSQPSMENVRTLFNFRRRLPAKPL